MREPEFNKDLRLVVGDIYVGLDHFFRALQLVGVFYFFIVIEFFIADGVVSFGEKICDELLLGWWDEDGDIGAALLDCVAVGCSQGARIWEADAEFQK